MNADPPRPEAARAHPNGARLALLAACNGVWALLMRRFEQGGVYETMGLYAVLVAVLLGMLYRTELARWFRLDRRAMMVGLAAGVAMTLATYPVFELAVALAPALERHVSELYAASRQGPILVATAWVLVVLTAEEILWRGAWMHALEARFGTLRAGAFSVGLYSLAQAGSGSFIVFGLAVACGALWTYMRVRTGSLWAPLIAHAIWTPVVILLVPLA